MLPFLFDPRIKRRNGMMPLQVSLPKHQYYILLSRASNQGVSIEDFAHMLLQDSLRHVLDSEFYTLGIDPGSADVGLVEEISRGHAGVVIDLFEFTPDRRIRRRKGRMPLQIVLPIDIYDSLYIRAGLGGSIEDYAQRLIEDSLRVLIDAEFAELDFDPSSAAPEAVEMAYRGDYRDMTIAELSTRTRLTKPFLAELSQAGRIPGARQIPQFTPWRYELRSVTEWIKSDEPRHLYQANPRRRVR